MASKSACIRIHSRVELRALDLAPQVQEPKIAAQKQRLGKLSRRPIGTLPPDLVRRPGDRKEYEGSLLPGRDRRGSERTGAGRIDVARNTLRVAVADHPRIRLGRRRPKGAYDYESDQQLPVNARRSGRKLRPRTTPTESHGRGSYIGAPMPIATISRFIR